MNLEKAIEILIYWRDVGECRDSRELEKAENLGIEALKYRLELEQTDPDILLDLLPGETLE